MFPIVYYVKGILKNLFNSYISIFTIVSTNIKVDKTPYIYRDVKVRCVIAARSKVIGQKNECLLQYLKEFFKQVIAGRIDYGNLLPMTIGITNNKHKKIIQF